jgi:lipoprotein-releasing system permease protein
MKTEFFLAWRYLFRGNARHISFIGIVSVLGVTLGVATLIIVISVMNGFERDLMDKMMQFNYHITADSIDRDIDPKLVEKIVATDEVESAAVFAQTQIFASLQETIVPLIVKGIDFNNEHEKKQFMNYVTEQRSKEGAFWLGAGLRERFLLEDDISYYPLSRDLKLKKGKIKGFFKVGLYNLDNSYAICDVEDAKKLSENYLLSIGIQIKDPFAAKEVKRKLSWLAQEGFLLRTWSESNRSFFSALQLEKITMFIILSLIILVASFNIFATLTVKVVEKTKDIGILKTLGFSSRQILFIFSFQGFLLGLIGVACGSGLGLLLCWLLENYHFIKIPQEIYAIDYLPIWYSVKDIVLIAAVGMVLSFISSLLPASRAAKLGPVEALRYE